MACSSCKTSNKTCSCKDTPFTTPMTYSCPPNTLCPDPTPCYETTQDTCVVHRNYTIINFGINTSSAEYVQFNLTPGMTLENIYQYMSLNAYNAFCTPVLKVHPSYIGTTAITIAWEDTGADYYSIEISPDQGITWSIASPITVTNYTFSTLNAATEYYFKVTTNCNLGQSTSATIAVTTLGLT